MNQPSKNARNKRISNARQRQQQHLLDVKLRASTERSRRFQAVCGFVFKTIFYVGLIAGIWFGGKEGLRRFVWENPDYFVHEINFATDGALTREQVLAKAEIAENRNIFTIDIGRTRAAIEQLPQVESAVVQRVFPSRINITVTERRPIAWVAAKGDEDPSASERSFLIDGRGIVLRSRVLLPEYFHLPVITGFETENLVPGKRVNVLEMQSALELIRLNAESTRFQIQNIDLAKGYCLVVTDQHHAKITFGLDRMDAQLARYYRCVERATKEHREIQTVNLVVERNVPVTFVDQEAEASAVEDPTKPKTPPAPEQRPTTPAPKGPEVRKAEPVTPKSLSRPTAPPTHAAAPIHAASPTPSYRKPFRLNP
jgi:cell division septal protein FtsQ